MRGIEIVRKAAQNRPKRLSLAPSIDQASDYPHADTSASAFTPALSTGSSLRYSAQDSGANPLSACSPMRLTAAIAQSRIRKIAQVSGNVKLGKHARERMVAREIFDVDVFRVLREGYVDEDPQLTEFENEWKC